ncbi:unnamed protein product, partial [Effrenium voratum]
ASTNLPASAVSEAGRALEFWRAFGVGRTGKAGHGPPLGWAPCDETSPLAEQAEMEVGPQELAGGLGLALRRGGGGATSAERRERRERREGRGELQSSALAGSGLRRWPAAALWPVELHQHQ